MIDPRQPKRTDRFGEARRRAQEADERWREVGYDAEVVERLRWDQRYSIIRAGDAAFAFSDYDKYLAALRAIWASGLVPDHGPSSVRGIDLPAVAPDLRGVDVELTVRGSAESDPES